MSRRWQIDIDRVMSRITGDIGGLYFFILPDGGRNLLMANYDRLFWPTTYGRELTDEEWAVIHQTYDGLMGDEPMSEVSDAIRYLADQIEIVVTQNNNNNQVCSCGSFGPVDTFINPNGDTLNPTNIPIAPPEGDGIPLLPPGQTTPTGFPTPEEWDNTRCILANYAVDMIIEVMAEITEAENKAGLALELFYLLVAALPGPYKQGRGYLALLKIAQTVADFLGATDVDLDIMELIRGVIEDNKQTAVCIVYSAANTLAAADELVSQVQEWVEGLPEWATWNAYERSWIYKLISGIVDIGAVNLAYNYAVSELIPDDYVPSIDCVGCGLPEPPTGYSFVPAQIASLAGTPASGGVTNVNIDYTSQGFTLSYTADGPGRNAIAVLRFVHPPVQTARIRGIGWTASNKINGGNFLMADNLVVPGGDRIIDGTVQTAVMGGMFGVRELNPLPVIAGYTGIYNGPGINLDYCEFPPTQDAGGFGVLSAGSGNVSITVDTFFWIVDHSRPC